MHSLQFGGGATQDLQSREADAHTHYFHIRNKASRPVTHVAGLFFYIPPSTITPTHNIKN